MSGVARGSIRAITIWPGPKTSPRIRDSFFTIDGGGDRVDGVDWPGTQRILKRELEHLGATDIVLELAVYASQIRQDGWVRSDATVRDAGVILSFQSDVGPMRYAVDRFTEWKANVRGIALALEALRKVNRYGVAGRAEQYRGWLAIPAQTGGVDPHKLIAKWSGWTEESVRKEPARAVALAKRAAHPDTWDGSDDDFKAVVAAGEVVAG